MNRRTAFSIVAGLVVLAVVAGVAWLVLGRDREENRRGQCAGATYELTAESDEQGTEVSFELQSAAPGEQWDIVLEQDTDELLAGSRTTDEDAEIDLDALAADADGETEFTVRFTPQGGEACTTTLQY